VESCGQKLNKAVFKKYPDVLDVKLVSKLLGVSTKTVYKLIKDGAILSLKVGREYRVPKAAVMRYIKLFGTHAREAAT
jgi:excisionase family DNA binding protein